MKKKLIISFKMAKTKKTYRRSYRSLKWRRFRTHNYYSAKIDVSGDLVFPTSSGQPQFSPATSNKMYFANLCGTYSPDWNKYTSIFQLYKLKGIRIEVMPTAGNSSINTITHTQPVYIGWTLSENEMAMSSFATSDKAFMLNPLEKTKKYWSLYGFQDDYKLVSTGLNGFIGAYTSENATDNTGPAWSFRVTLYVLFKLSKD